MKILDQYLLRQYLKSLMICFVSLTGLYIVFDAFANLESFLRASEKLGNLATVMGSFYFYRSLLFFDRSSCILGMIAAMFAVTWIQRHNELTAMMAAGISRVRVVKPIIIASIVLSVVAMLNREILIPQFAGELAKEPKNLAGDQAETMTPRWDNETDIMFNGRSVFRADRRIQDPLFRLPKGLNAYGTQLVADKAFYQDPTSDRPGGYLLQNVHEPKDIDSKASLALEGRPVILTRRDADWLASGQCFVVSNLTFDQLTGAMAFRQFASTPQLIMALHNPSLNYGGDVRVTVHSRIVQPLLDITLLFLGLPLVISRHTRNIFYAMSLCAALVLVFLMVTIGLHALGQAFPSYAALVSWAPLMIFVPIAVALYDSMRQ